MLEPNNNRVKWPFDEGDYLLAILVGVLLLSIFTFKQYGVSYDEPLMYRFADINTETYTHLFYGEPFDADLHFYNLEYYGAGYLILANPFVHLLTATYPSVERYQAWHLINFVVFLFGVWIIFKICLKFASKKASFIAALLFLTQPLLWGHGVMNPKDSAFMVAFLTAVYAGMQIIDPPEVEFPVYWAKVQAFLESIVRNTSRWLKIVIGSLFGLILLDRIFANFITSPLLTGWYSIITGHNGENGFSRLLPAFSQTIQQIPLVEFTQTRLRSINLIEFISIVLVFAIFMLYGLIRDKAKYSRSFLAGFVLGIAASIRILGPAAVFIVAVYWWVKKSKILPSMIMCYLLTALINTFCLWPYLWTAPFTRLIDTFEIMANFPWNGHVRFEGASLPTTQLPWYYLPKLIGIQFTLPILGLVLSGLGFSLVKKINRIALLKVNRNGLFVPILWFFVPLFGVMIFQPPLYDNFRQFIFITPPLFIFTAKGIDYLLPLIKSKVISIALVISILLPGVIAISWLHPYEYVYYNVLVGWTANIGRNYDNDYWGTSYCEAGDYIRTNAAPGSRIILQDGILMMVLDLCTHEEFDIIYEPDVISTQNPDYSIIWSRYDLDTYYNTNLPLAYVVRRGSTIFTVVRGEP